MGRCSIAQNDLTTSLPKSFSPTYQLYSGDSPRNRNYAAGVLDLSMLCLHCSATMVLEASSVRPE